MTQPAWRETVSERNAGVVPAGGVPGSTTTGGTAGPVSGTIPARSPLGVSGTGIVAASGMNELDPCLVTKSINLWNVTGVVNAAAIVDPFGGTGAFSITENGANSPHETFAACPSTSAPAPKHVTITALFKNLVGTRWVYFNVETTAIVDSFAYFNPSLGVLGANANTSGDVQTSLTPIGGGWFLFTMTVTVNPATALGNVSIGLSDVDGGFAYLGDGASSVATYGVNVSVYDSDLVEAATLGTVAPVRRVVAIVQNGHITETQLPANTGDLVVYIANAGTVPTANPVGGGIIYNDAGALKYRSPAGTVTTIGPL